MKRLLLALLLLTCATSALVRGDSPKVKPSAPIKDFRLPTFDKDGRRATFMRTSEAVFVTPTEVSVKDLHYSIFTKDGSGSFDTLLIAPSATFLTDKQVVRGEDMVRVIRLDLEISGEQWSYDHPAKRVLIGKNARVTFLEQLNDIIK